MRKTVGVVFLLFVLCSKNLFATVQIKDIFIADKDTSRIKSTPLESYFEKERRRTFIKAKSEEECSALARGYVATWKLENNALFLTRIQTDYCGDNPQDIDIKDEFCSDKVFAGWFTGTIVSPIGAKLDYDIYESEKYYTFKQGKLIDTKEMNYLERDNNLLFPGEKFLHDTIKTVIFKSIDKIIKEDVSLRVSFDENGEISSIRLYDRMDSKDTMPKNVYEETILKNAREALIGFPKIMKVTHEQYDPPDLTFYFSEYCLKFPNATGCKW